LKGDGLPDKRSHNRYITVIGEIITWPAPTVDQAMEGDLDPGLPLITIRFPAQTSWASTDRVQVTILASDVDGTVDYTAGRLVGQIAPGGQVAFDVPGTELKRFDGRAIEVFYSVTRGNERPQESLRRVYQVQIPHELPVPKLIQATGSGTLVNLAPMNAQDGATVEVRFLMYTTDSIKITMTGTAGAGSPVIAAKPGSTSGVVTFDIPKEAIAANIGNTNKTFTLKYEVTNGDVVRPSVVLKVTVTPIPASELAKTLIRINEAGPASRVLDLWTTIANRTLRVGTWPFITSGKPVWMELRGFKANGTAHNLPVWNGGGAQTNPTWLSRGWWEYAISYLSYLRELGDNTKLELHFKAALGSDITAANAIIFPVVEYTVQSSWRDSITDFEDGTTDGWALGEGGGSGNVINGYIEFLTPNAKNDGCVLTKNFRFEARRTYEFSFDVMNITPEVSNVDLWLSVYLLYTSTPPYYLIFGGLRVPRTGRWYTFSGQIRDSQAGVYPIAIFNSGPLGGGDYSEGGNDFRIDNITLRRL
jgi:hypothetical protein